MAIIMVPLIRALVAIDSFATLFLFLSRTVYKNMDHRESVETASVSGHADGEIGRSMVLRRDSPQILLSSSSRFPNTLDKLKIRKRVNLFPLRVTLKADYETSNRAFTYGCSVKVSV